MIEKKLDNITLSVLTKIKSSELKEAFNTIIEAYNKKTYWHIRRILINHEDTNDVLQNTFIKIWNGLNKFKGDAKIYTWIFRIATNEAITFLNKKRLKTTSIEEYNAPITTQEDISMDATEIEIKLEHAISLLPEKQRIVFNLKYFENLKYDEISIITNTSVGALKASYHLAVKKIEKKLTND